MKTFKDFLMDDHQVFFNADELATTANVDGKDILVQIDEDRLKEKANVEYGVTAGLILYFVKVSDLANLPRVGNQQVFNNRLYYIDDVLETSGVCEITLNQNRGE